MDHYFLTLTNEGGPLRTIQRLKLRCDSMLPNVAANSKLCRYSEAILMMSTAPRYGGAACRLTLSNPR
jgi:hypothetical protein